MKRLVEGSLPARATALLRSAASDVPPRADEEKARLVSVVASPAAARDPRGGFASGRWLGAVSLVMVATAGALSGGYYLSSPSLTPQVSTQIDEPPLAPAHASPAQTAELAAPATLPKSVDVMDLPSASVGRPQPGRRPAPPVTEPPPEGPAATATPRAGSGARSLEDELQAVDAARAAFVEHDPKLALDRVESYRRRFPEGHFMDEVEALEIQSLGALGRNEEARARAARFLATRPESPYAQRVRSAVGIKK